MTLRDQFAMAALTGLLANNRGFENQRPISVRAYELADQMLGCRMQSDPHPWRRVSMRSMGSLNPGDRAWITLEGGTEVIDATATEEGWRTIEGALLGYSTVGWVKMQPPPVPPEGPPV